MLEPTERGDESDDFDLTRRGGAGDSTFDKDGECWIDDRDWLGESPVEMPSASLSSSSSSSAVDVSEGKGASSKAAAASCTSSSTSPVTVEFDPSPRFLRSLRRRASRSSFIELLRS